MSRGYPANETMDHVQMECWYVFFSHFTLAVHSTMPLASRSFRRTISRAFMAGTASHLHLTSPSPPHSRLPHNVPSLITSHANAFRRKERRRWPWQPLATFIFCSLLVDKHPPFLPTLLSFPSPSTRAFGLEHASHAVASRAKLSR